MTQNCKNCTNKFTPTDKSFLDKLDVPEPSHCPDCRQQRRLTWRNERTLHKRKCDATGKNMVSVYTEDAKFPVYENEYWYGDKWDALDFGRDFDFNRPFFEQFQELMNEVPQLARSAVQNQNCDYVNQCGWCKNCYLIFEADHNQDCYYANNIYDSRATMDCLTVTNCELCYECIDCYDSYNLKFSQNSQNCSDSWFLKNCIGCRNCYGCVNLKNKEYHFLNQKLSKEKYEEKVAELNLNTTESLHKAREDFQKFTLQYPHKFLEGTQNEDCTGNYMFNNQRCEHCFDINNSQDCKYVYNSRNMKDCQDITVFGSKEGAQLCYDTHETGAGTQRIIFSDQIWSGCSDIAYSKICVFNSHDLFGCVGLKKQSYCIFNKQYSEEEYHALRAKIIEHMKSTGEYGEFFPATLSPFAYNDTIAQFYYPLTKEEAKSQGYAWRDPDPKEYLPQSYQIPEKIDEAPDTVTQEVLACSDCKKNYKIHNEELKLYRRHKLPISQKCPDCRHIVRFKLRNPRTLCQRSCQKCNSAITTSFAEDRPEIVYCGDCYKDALV